MRMRERKKERKNRMRREGRREKEKRRKEKRRERVGFNVTGSKVLLRIREESSSSLFFSYSHLF